MITIQDNITFNDVKTNGVSTAQWPFILLQTDRIGPDDDGGIINAVDIDWNGAQVGDKTINTTGQLLAYLNEKVDESDFVDLLNEYITTDDSLVAEPIEEDGQLKFSIKVNKPAKPIIISTTSKNIAYNGTAELTASYMDGSDIDGNDLTWTIQSLDRNYAHFGNGSIQTSGSTVNLIGTNDYNAFTSTHEAQIDRINSSIPSTIAYDGTASVELIIVPKFTQGSTDDKDIIITCVDGDGNSSTIIVTLQGYSNITYNMDSVEAWIDDGQNLYPLQASLNISTNENQIIHSWSFINKNTQSSNQNAIIKVGINNHNNEFEGVDWWESDTIVCEPQK